MAKNSMRLKEYEFNIIADTIDSLLSSMDFISMSIDNYDQQYHENGDEWYKHQADENRSRLSAYDNIISYLEKYR